MAYSLKDLDAETDARFWAQTGFSPGKKLDPHNPRDAAMMPVWNQIFADVKKQDAAGILQLTYNSPIVQQHIGDAQAATADAIHHLDAAASATSPADVKHHIAAATQASAKSQQSSAAAAAHQPATASPSVVADAMKTIHTISGLGHQVGELLGPLVSLFTPASDAAAAQAGTAPPVTAEDHIAVQQAGQAPLNAVAAHAGLPGVAGPPPKMSEEKPTFMEWVKKHAEIIAVGGAIAVGGIIAAVATPGRAPARRRRRLA